MNTEFNETKNIMSTYTGEYGDETLGVIETIITGDLADKVQARSGLTGTVTIVEEYWNSGFCETCSYPEHDWYVFVNGENVWSTNGWDASNAQELTQFGEFQAWLDGKDGE